MLRAASCFDFSSSFSFDVLISDGPEQYQGFWWETYSVGKLDWGRCVQILDEKSEFNTVSLGVLYLGAWLHSPSAVTASSNHTC